MDTGALVVVVPALCWVVAVVFVVAVFVVVVAPVVVVVNKLLKGVPSDNLTALGLANIP